MADRRARVAETIKEELGLMIERGEIKDPRIGFVTFTQVDLSKDLKRARIYFSALGSLEERRQTHDGLESARGFVRTEIGKRLRLKYVPEIEFIYDETVESSARISKLIHDIHTKKQSDGQ